MGIEKLDRHCQEQYGEFAWRFGPSGAMQSTREQHVHQAFEVKQPSQKKSRYKNMAASE